MEKEMKKEMVTYLDNKFKLKTLKNIMEEGDSIIAQKETKASQNIIDAASYCRCFTYVINF
jgi:hypothetical protein